jgi:hypothetical protein
MKLIGLIILSFFFLRKGFILRKPHSKSPNFYRNPLDNLGITQTTSKAHRRNTSPPEKLEPRPAPPPGFTRGAKLCWCHKIRRSEPPPRRNVDIERPSAACMWRQEEKRDPVAAGDRATGGWKYLAAAIDRGTIESHPYTREREETPTSAVGDHTDSRAEAEQAKVTHRSNILAEEDTEAISITPEQTCKLYSSEQPDLRHRTPMLHHQQQRRAKPRRNKKTMNPIYNCTTIRDGNGYKPTGFMLLRPIPTKEKFSHGLPI